MNRRFLLILLLLAWLILGALFLRYMLCGLGAVAGGSDSEENTTAIVPATTTSDRLLIQDGSSFKTTAANHFDFNGSSFNYLTPLAAGVSSSLEKTATYLKGNPNRTLTITGLYKSDEDNPSGVFNTLGEARANEVKKALTDLGVPGKQLLTGERLLGVGMDLKDGVLLSGVDFSFAESATDNADRLAAIKAKYDANPITIYFQTGQENVALTSEQKQAFSELIFYLDNVDGSSLEVGGHTDNVGEEDLNKRLSRKRAEFARDYLTSNGLPSNRLSAQGYGPDAPLGPNDSPAGRAKNRRVEVRLK